MSEQSGRRGRSRGLNKVQIIGNLGRDPEMRFTQDGTPVTNFSVAVNDSWQGRDGEQRERTEWFRIVAWRRRQRTEWHRLVLWRRLAEITNEYLRQGSRVYVEGRLETREWQDREGNDRTTTELIARDLLMLGGRDNEGSEQIQPENDERPVNDDEITADDLPF